MSPAASEACERLAETLIKALVWHESITLSAAATQEGGASLILTDKDLSKRFTIVIDQQGAPGRVIRIGKDNAAVSEPFNPSGTNEYLKWLF